MYAAARWAMYCCSSRFRLQVPQALKADWVGSQRLSIIFEEVKDGFGKTALNIAMVLATSVTTCLMMLGGMFILANVLSITEGIGQSMEPLDTETVTAFRYGRNIRADKVVQEEDLVRIEIPRIVAEHVGRLLEREEMEILAIGRKINRNVNEDELAMVTHFASYDIPGPEDNMSSDKVQVAIPVDPERTSGMSLRVGNYVNLLGLLPTKSGSYKTYRIIERLRVVAIDGQTDRRDYFDDDSNTTKPAVRAFKTIAVEMQREHTDVSLQWSNLSTHLAGSAFIEICPTRSVRKKGGDGMIAPELIPFTLRAADTLPGDDESQPY